jgi:prepilin-type N-terminal cleavage/methylation domain-containing protein
MVRGSAAHGPTLADVMGTERTHIPSARGRHGFTLVELIALMVITSIVAAVAVPALASMTAARRRVAARMVQRDIAFARERALATGTVHWVVFAAGADTYSVLAVDPADPGRAGATAIADPATGREMLVRLNSGEFAGVDLTGAAFGAGSELGFDWLGRPLGAGAVLLATPGSVTMSGGYTVTVSTGGLAAWTGP